MEDEIKNIHKGEAESTKELLEECYSCRNDLDFNLSLAETRANLNALFKLFK